MCWNLTGTCLYCPPVSSHLLFLFEPHLIVLHIDVTVFRFPIDFLLWNSYYTHHTFDSGAFLNTSQSLCTQWLSESALFRLPSALATGGPVPLDRWTSYHLFQVINFPLDFKYFFLLLLSSQNWGKFSLAAFVWDAISQKPVPATLHKRLYAPWERSVI